MSKCRIEIQGGKPKLLPVKTFILQQINTAKRNSIVEGNVVDVVKLKSEIKKALTEIGNRYYKNQMDLVVMAMEAVLDPKSGNFPPIFKNYFPEHWQYYLHESTRTKMEEIDKQTYEASEESSDGEIEDDSFFLDLKFGFETTLKEQIKREVSHELLNSFIINRDRNNSEHGYIIRTIEEANVNVREYKQRLFDTLIKYIKRINKSKTLPESLQLFDGKEYTGILQNETISEIIQGLRNISQNELLRLYNNVKKENKHAKEELDAIKALFILDNFDSFVNLLMGDVVTVNPNHINKLTSGDNYKFSDKGGNVIISWRTDDNQVMEAEIGQLVQTLINSSSYFKFGSSMPVADTYLKFEDFYRIVTKIKDLALDSNLATIVTGKESWFKKLTEKEQNAIKGKSLRNIITNIRLNPQVYTRIAFTALCNLGNDTKGSIQALKSLDFNEEEQGKLWSIYKAVFDNSDNFSIKSIQSQYEYDTKNYYEVLTQAIDSMFSVDYMQYSEDDNTIKVSSLKDSELEQTRYQLQSSILNSNSRNVIQNNFEKNHMEPYEAEIIFKEPRKGSKEKIPTGIRYKIKDTVIEYTIQNGLSINGNDLIEGTTLTSAVKQFIDAQLNLDLQFDTELYNNLVTVHNNNVTNTLKTLLELSTVTLFNKYISNVTLKDKKTKTGIQNQLKVIYSDNMKLIPRYNEKLMEMELLSQKDAANLRNLAKAKMLTTGQAQSATVRTSEGNQLSLQTTSRLLGNLAFQHDQITDDSQRYVKTVSSAINNGEYVSQSGERYVVKQSNTNADIITLNGNTFVLNNKMLTERWSHYGGFVFKSKDEYFTYLLEKELLKLQHPLLSNEVLSNRVIRNLHYNRNAASGFSLFAPGFYTGFYTEKEFVGNKTKARTQFTPSEAMHASFMYSFVGGLIKKTDVLGKEIIGNGKIGLLPSVNSDKNTMGEAIFDLNKTFNDGSGRTWRDLMLSTDPADILSLENAICEELEQCYQISLDNIQSDFLELVSWLQEHKHEERFKDLKIPDNIVIDPFTDYKEFNEYALSLGTDAATLLFEWTKAYNNNNVNKIQLIDQTHFITSSTNVYENGKVVEKKIIKFNNTFKRLLERYRDTGKFHKFMQMKRSELLVSLLNENFSVNLMGDLQETNDVTPKQFLTQYGNGDWSNAKDTIISIDYIVEENGKKVKHKVQGKNLNRMYERAVAKGYAGTFEEFQVLKATDKQMQQIRGKMILAKITVKGRTINIITKDDLKLVRNLVKGRPDFFANPHELFNPEYGLEVEIHPLLDRYNTMDYFLTQEFMISGVGTHTNHPSKTKYKTPVVWGHPAIGKTYAMEYSRYKDQLMDWDEEFNVNRDNWIAEKTGTVKDTPEFKAVRNEYMINYTQHPDYVEFVKAEWERIKALANSQNKILIASPHMLLDLFGNEFDKILTMEFDDFVDRSKRRGDAVQEAWKIGIDESLAPFKDSDKVVTISPDDTFTSLLEHSNVLYNELQQILENDIQEEAARFLAQHKRNVSYTAAMYPFQLNQIKGIPSTYNMAVIDDIKSNVFTITGDYDSHKPFDGATFVNPLVVYWENESLQESRAGIDKKQFIHFYDYKTGTGGIVKTAGFGVTNNRAKKDKFYRDMAYNMMKRTWKNENGTDHISEQGIFVDMLGHEIKIGDIYFEKDGKYYKREIKEYLGNNQYSVMDYEVDIYGDIIEQEETEPKIIPVNSNYDTWMLLGGYNSVDLNNGVLENSEISLKRTADIANRYGTPKSEKVETAEDVYQPMKHSDIHYMPTVGAIKQGACNINPSSYFYGHHELNFMRVQMTQAGIQLDKEHHADASVLSLMTQVISAACSRGYTKDHALKLYKALEQLTKLGTKEFRNELGNIIEGDSSKFNEAVSNILLQNILNSKGNDDDMLQIVARDIIREAMTSNAFSFNKETLNKFDSSVPYSDNSIFNKIVSSLTVALTKSGIKTKMPGILSVLCPTQDIIKFYKIPVLDEEGQPTGKYKRVSFGQLEKALKLSDEQLDQKLDELQSDEPNLQNEDGSIDFSQIEVGYKYLVKYADGTTKMVHVAGPHYFEKEKSLGSRIHGGVNIPAVVTGYKNLKTDSNIVEIKEWIKEGQDLRSYNVRFKDSNGKSSFQMYDLDIVQDYFALKQLKPKEQFAQALVYLNKYGKFDEYITRMQTDLASVYESNSLYDPNYNYLNYSESLEGKNKAIVGFNESYNVLKQLLKQLTTTGNIDFAEISSNLTPERVSAIVEQFKTYANSYALRGLNRELQTTLDGISPSSGRTIVKINGHSVTINKNSIVKSCYGAIMPKTFKSNFGLDQFDQVEDIKADPDFFTKKLASKLLTKVEGYTSIDGNTITNNFHLELKRPDGNHIYIRKGLTSDNESKLRTYRSSLTEEVPIITITEADGSIYRIDSKRNKMYQMFSKDDKVYKDADGNEIIVTSSYTEYYDENNNLVDPTMYTLVDGKAIHKETGEELRAVLKDGIRFYLDKLDYTTFNISKDSSNSEFDYVLQQAIASSNSDSRKLALEIYNSGNSRSARRSYSEELNDYKSIIDRTGKFKKGTAKRIESRLTKLGRKMHTSFLQSLNIIAARIPAQSQQSFMPMQIEAYEDPDVNTAYVSTFQFYLQGSDLDIDAVSLQTFDIDKNGLFVGHSPYYSLENETLRAASESLPFPTGESINLVETQNTKNTFIEKYKDLFGKLIKIEYHLNDGLKVTFDTSTVENIQELGKLIEDVNTNGLLVHKKNKNGQMNETFVKRIEKILAEQLPEEFINNEQIRDSFESAIQQAFDKHNLYLQKSNTEKRQSIIRNYITTQLFGISSDPINLIESQSSVDSMTSTAKDLAKLSPKASVQNHFTPGNVMNKFQSISENMVGKDGIAICATGLKSFFAITELYQQMLNVDVVNMQLTEQEINDIKESVVLVGTKEQQQKQLQELLDERLQQKKQIALDNKKLLLFSRSIGGKTYNGLANGYSDQVLSYFESNLTEYDINVQNENFSELGYKYLIDQLWSSDAANEMSALLSLSTDNAKELVLAKINAGIGTIGMYLYGLSLGMSFDSIYKIMTSPLAFRLAELTKGDVFNKEEGSPDIMSVLKYLRREPSLASFDQRLDASSKFKIKPSVRTKTILEKCIKDLFPKEWEKYEQAIEKYKQDKKKDKSAKEPENPFKNPIQFIVRATSKSNSEVSIWDVKDYIDKLRPTKLTDKKVEEEEVVKIDHNIALINQALDFVKQYLDDASLLYRNTSYYNIYGRQNLVEDIEQLAMGAMEMKEMGKILRLNQEIKTNAGDLIAQVANIEEAIIRRAKVVVDYYGSKRRLEQRYAEDHPELSKKQVKQAIALLTSDKMDNYKIDLERFLRDEGYRNEKIQQYNLIKQSYNPLQIISEVPHYRGYVESMFIAYKGLKNKSVKFKILSDYVQDWIKTNRTGKDLHQQVIKNAQEAVSLYLRQQWMRSNPNIKISVHAETPLFSKSLVKAIPTKVVTPIQLGTEIGDANFKIWMETVMIPKWKKEYPDNKFIQGLKPTVNSSTNRGTVGISYSLPINMLPKSDYEKSVFNDYVYEFNKLGLATDGKGEQYDMKDLLFLYSLITNNGRIGPRSLHKIFNDYIKSRGEGSLPHSYRAFINEKDSDPNSYDEIVEFLGKGYMIAPIVSTISSKNGTIVRYRDSELGQVLILEMKKEDKQSSFVGEDGQEYENDDYNEYQQESYEEIMIQQMNMDDGESQNNSRNYGSYSIVESIQMNGNPIYFQNAVHVKEQKIKTVKDFKYADEFKITLDENGYVVNIEGLDDSSSEIAKQLIKDINRNPKNYVRITLNSKTGKQIVTDIEKLERKIEQLKTKC